MEAIAPTLGQRQALLQSVIEPSADEIRAGLKIPGAAHHALADLIARSYVRVIVTTNFDRLIETALRSADRGADAVRAATSANADRVSRRNSALRWPHPQYAPPAGGLRTLCRGCHPPS